jgi:O-methyltransferase
MSNESLARRYIELLKSCLSRELFIDEEPHDVDPGPDLAITIGPLLTEQGWRLVTLGGDPAQRTVGQDWPPFAETMIGTRRLDNLVACVTDVLERGVPGDLVETGVWRGGATILMRGLLAAYGDTTRRVWVADSFRGLPPPDAERYPADEGINLSGIPILAVGADEVRANFARYGLLDEQVVLLEGWFRDTLRAAPIERLAVLRLDGDLYESTFDALEALYPKLSPGGYVIVDDYHAIDACRKAVDEYRFEHDISEPIDRVDWTGVFWQRGASA